MFHLGKVYISLVHLNIYFTGIGFTCSIACVYLWWFAYRYIFIWWHIRAMLQRKILAMVHLWYLILIHLFWMMNLNKYLGFMEKLEMWVVLVGFHLFFCEFCNDTSILNIICVTADLWISSIESCQIYGILWCSSCRSFSSCIEWDLLCWEAH